MRNFRLIAGIIFLWGFISISASDFVDSSWVINQDIKLLIDSSRTLNLSKVLEIQNKAKPINSQFIVPSIDYDYWFILKCKNTSNCNLDQYVGFDIACFETVDLYYKDSINWIHKKNGLIVPIDEREIFSRLPGFKVAFNAHEEKTIYLHLHSKYLVPTNIVNQEFSSFIKTDIKSLFAYWGYIGAAISILLYNLLLFLQVRDKVYLYYLSYVLCLIVWISLDSGLFLYVSSNVRLYYFLSIGTPTMGFFQVLFTREILKTKTLNKWLDFVIVIISIAFLLIAILVGFNVYYYQYLGMIAMPFTLFSLLVGIYAMLKGVPLSKFYITASSFYILGLFSYAGLTLNAIPYNSLTRYGFIVGSFFELIVFSLALGHRIKLLQAEKVKYQNKVIENERIMSMTLEVQVAKRTLELQDVSTQLVNSNKQLQKSNNAKDKLFSIISHDLRGPFGAVLGLLESYKDNYHSYEVNQRKELIDTIFDSTSKTFNMLENLLFWSRNQTNGLMFNPIEFDITQMTQEIYQILDNQARSKNIAVKVPNSAIAVFADCEMIKIVIRNLISNAIKFTKKGGEIIITLSKNNNPQKEIVFSIKDSGIGISLEEQECLFNLDSNISAVGTHHEKGTGLGLVLCKELLETHEGRIWVESELGIGSTFYFAIPY